ncbi:MAG: GDP-mannose 4,6-dehydratase [Verrucomicrobiota bacterium]|jgi:UDP-glucose 4-epimerase|nr:GDP-mannose 4,6-dehydratase [Verrucomicrobiota bacterium]
MRALITGGAGFIGSHLAERMMGNGWKVTVVDDLSTGSFSNLDGLRGRAGFEFIRETVRNEVSLTSLVDRCDVIIHLAAAVGVQLIVDRPVHTLETNIHGAEVVLHLASKFGRKVILASTSEVYGKSDRIPFGEDDDTILGSTRFTRWSYACSKMVDEFLGLAYHDQYGLPVVICRFFNTVGPRQTGQYGMVVPRFVRRALSAEPLQIHGNGRQTRCFSNVRDVVRAVEALVDCEAAVGEVINVGSDEQVSIEQLADRVLTLTGSPSEKRYLTYEEAYGRPFDDMMARMPSLAKIHRLIGYRPEYDLDETLKQIIDWERRLS